MIRPCEHCSERFEASAGARFCSEACYDAAAEEAAQKVERNAMDLGAADTVPDEPARPDPRQWVRMLELLRWSTLELYEGNWTEVRTMLAYARKALDENKLIPLPPTCAGVGDPDGVIDGSIDW